MIYFRRKGCYSVKCRCETTNCSLCTVWIDGNTFSFLLRACGKSGRKESNNTGRSSGRSSKFGAFLAAGQSSVDTVRLVIMNVLAMVKGEDPTLEEVKEYLAGNLCGCTGYMGQLRAIQVFRDERTK